MQNKANFQITRIATSSLCYKAYAKRAGPGLAKNKANFKRDDGFSTCYTKDCHGPWSLAMTFVGGLLRGMAGGEGKNVRRACQLTGSRLFTSRAVGGIIANL